MTVQSTANGVSDFLSWLWSSHIAHRSHLCLSQRTVFITLEIGTCVKFEIKVSVFSGFSGWIQGNRLEKKRSSIKRR